MRKKISALITVAIFMGLLMPCVQADLIDASELRNGKDMSNIFTEDFNDSFDVTLPGNNTQIIDNRKHYTSYEHSTSDGGMKFTMSGNKIVVKTTNVNSKGVMFFNRDMLYENDMGKDYEISMTARRDADNNMGTGSINENIGMRLRSHGNYNKNYYETGISTSYLVPAGYSSILSAYPDHPYIIKFNDTDPNFSIGSVYTYMFNDVPRLAPYQTFEMTSGIVSGKLDNGTPYDKIYFEGNFENRANSNTSGTRDIAADNNIAGGQYSWESYTQNGKLYVKYSGYIIDVHPFSDPLATDPATFTTGISLISQGGAVSTTSDGQVEIYDLKLNVLESPYEEPENLIYQNIAYGKTFSSDGIMELDDSERIRRINVTEPSDIYAKDEGDSEYKLLCSADAFSDNTWLNTETNARFKYIKLDTPQEIKLYTETDTEETINLFMGESMEFLPKVNGSFEDITQTVTSDALSVENGIVKALTKGSANLVFTSNGNEISLPFVVMGELEYAEHTGTVPEYILDKTPIMNNINTALAEKDSDKLYNTVFGEGNDTLENLIDFERGEIMKLSPDGKDKYISRLATYECFGDENVTVDSIKALIKALENEKLVSKLLTSSSSTEAGEIIESNNDVFGCNLEAEDFLKYKSDALDILRTADIENVDDVKKEFVNSYILADFHENISSGGIISIIEKYKDEIGYNTEKYGKISNKDNLGYALLTSKSSIKTIENLKTKIDNYTPSNTATNNSSGGSSGSGSGGGSRGNSITTIGMSIPNTSVKEEASLFSDITTDHWAYESIKQLSALKIITGYPDGTVGADKNITRAEFVQMIVSAFDYTVPEDNETENFNDAETNDWFYDTMLAAKVNGIVEGEADKCNPSSNITREEMAVMIFRVINNKGIKAETVNGAVEFDDADSISEWAYLSVMQLYKCDVVSGISNTEFGAKQLATRAQAAKMIGSVLNMSEEGE